MGTGRLGRTLLERFIDSEVAGFNGRFHGIEMPTPIFVFRILLLSTIANDSQKKIAYDLGISRGLVSRYYRTVTSGKDYWLKSKMEDDLLHFVMQHIQRKSVKLKQAFSQAAIRTDSTKTVSFRQRLFTDACREFRDVTRYADNVWIEKILLALRNSLPVKDAYFRLQTYFVVKTCFKYLGTNSDRSQAEKYVQTEDCRDYCVHYLKNALIDMLRKPTKLDIESRILAIAVMKDCF
jgi:hypothetical protein